MVDLVIRSGTVMTLHRRLEGGGAVDGGVIVAAGADADFTIVDMAREGTIVRGRVIMRDGELVGEPGWGKPVVPATTTVAA